jgi:hypothetical protein
MIPAVHQIDPILWVMAILFFAIIAAVAWADYRQARKQRLLKPYLGETFGERVRGFKAER